MVRYSQKTSFFCRHFVWEHDSESPYQLGCFPEEVHFFCTMYNNCPCTIHYFVTPFCDKWTNLELFLSLQVDILLIVFFFQSNLKTRIFISQFYILGTYTIIILDYF